MTTKNNLTDCLKRFLICGTSFLVMMLGISTPAKGTAVETLFFLFSAGIFVVAFCYFVAFVFYFGAWLCELAIHRGKAGSR